MLLELVDALRARRATSVRFPGVLEVDFDGPPPAPEPEPLTPAESDELRAQRAAAEKLERERLERWSA